MTADNVHGDHDPRFSPLVQAFDANVADGLEIGASLCVFHHGRKVVDVWGGHTDTTRAAPWQRDTIVNVWSSTKGIVAMGAAMLVSRGQLDIDAPVAAYWPEFKAAGKQDVPVRLLLTHEAGLPGIRAPRLGPEAFEDWDLMTSLLAAEEPWWPPGAALGYHAFTYGYLVGEVIRRITGRTVGEFVVDEIAGPLAADFHIGLPLQEHGRVASIRNPPADTTKRLNVALGDADSLTARALSNPALVPDFERANTSGWRTAEIPAANGHGNARSLATIYAVLAAGGSWQGQPFVAVDVLDRFTSVHVDAIDIVGQVPRKWGLGFLVDPTRVFYDGPSHTFGHAGAGGSIGFADRDHELAFGYAMNAMVDTVPDPRHLRLIPALYGCL